jgi:hypothetical protein
MTLSLIANEHRVLSSAVLSACFHAGFLLVLIFDPENGGDIFLRNVDFQRTTRRYIQPLWKPQSYKNLNTSLYYKNSLVAKRKGKTTNVASCKIVSHIFSATVTYANRVSTRVSSHLNREYSQLSKYRAHVYTSDNWQCPAHHNQSSILTNFRHSSVTCDAFVYSGYSRKRLHPRSSSSEERAPALGGMPWVQCDNT